MHAGQVPWPCYHELTERFPMFPNTPTTYKLPFDDTIRVGSRFRFVLVRQYNTGNEKPFVVRRSDDLATLERIYDPSTDFLIDQARGFLSYHFNGKRETFDAIEGKHVYYGPGPFVTSQKKQVI
jgi:hypothetical protein